MPEGQAFGAQASQDRSGAAAQGRARQSGRVQLGAGREVRLHRGGHPQGPQEARRDAKKKRVAYRERSEEKRLSFRNEIQAIPESKQVYIDECGVRREHMREYAYAPRGESVDAVISGRNRKAANVIGALCEGRHIGIEVYEHATASAFFEEWFARCCPCCRGRAR